MTPQYTILPSDEGYVVALHTHGPMIYGHGATIDDAKRDAKRKAQRAGLWDYAQEEA
jgi:hypothetical protein